MGKKQKTIPNKIKELIKNIPREEIDKFIIDYSTTDKTFRNLFFSFFASYNEDESMQDYKKQIRSIVRSYSDKYGFLHRSAARQVEIIVSEYVNTAQKHFENNNFKSGFFICTAVMEEMTDALQYGDDSDAAIHINIDYAFDIITKYLIDKATDNDKELAFEYCLSAFKKKTFYDWDWHFDILNLACEIMNNKQQAQRIWNVLEDKYESRYDQKKADWMKYKIIEFTKGEPEADKFLEQHIYHESFRKQLTEKAIKSKNYDEAKRIAEQGIEQDKKERPGLVRTWKNYLLRIAQKENDTEKIIEYARFLLIDNFHPEQDYYQILKDHIPTEKWNDFFQNLIYDLEGDEIWGNFGLIANIYIKEKMWKNLLALLQKDPHLNTIESYEKYLAKDYSSEISELYADEIIKFLNNNVSRKYYRTACRYIKRISNLGRYEKVNEIIEYLRSKYKNRPALLEELDKIK